MHNGLAHGRSKRLAPVRQIAREPFWLETTQYNLSFASLNPSAPPLRIVHLTDLHIERATGREIKAVARVNALQPDLVVITGDHINTSYHNDPTAREALTPHLNGTADFGNAAEAA